MYPSQCAPPVTTQQLVFLVDSNFLDCVLSLQDLGDHVLHSFKTSYKYICMRWYFKVSHMYMFPRSTGDPLTPPGQKGAWWDFSRRGGEHATCWYRPTTMSHHEVDKCKQGVESGRDWSVIFLKFWCVQIIWFDSCWRIDINMQICVLSAQKCMFFVLLLFGLYHHVLLIRII